MGRKKKDAFRFLFPTPTRRFSSRRSPAMSAFPHHLLASTATTLVTASHHHLFVFAKNSPTLLASTLAAPVAHKTFIRLIATHVDPATKQEYLVSTSEDKLLLLWKLPNLEFISERELAKRANGLDIAANGDIAVGDKFGDVFLFVFLSLSLILHS